MLWIITQESTEEHHGDIFQRYGTMFKYMGCDTYLIRGVGVEAPGEVKNKPDIMTRAEEMAQNLVL